MPFGDRCEDAFASSCDYQKFGIFFLRGTSHAIGFGTEAGTARAQSIEFEGSYETRQ